MKQPSFLARRTFGAPNYFLIALAVAFLVAFVPRGVRRAIEGNTNKAEDWLPASYDESKDLRWFRKHFIGEQFALISWEGCTLGDDEKLRLFAKKLVPSQEDVQNTQRAAEKAAIEQGPDSEQAEALAKRALDLEQRASWYKHVETGPQVIERLTQPPLGLSYGEAVKRFEGALVGPAKKDARGNSLGVDSRTTCLIVYLSKEATQNNKTMRAAIENLSRIADTECAIPAANIHMGGPPVDNITIDIEGEKTLIRLALLSGIVGFALSYWCFRSIKLTTIVFAVGVMSAGMSLAIVFYFGVVEVLVTGMQSPRLGAVDAIMMSMPAVVYVLGLSGAIHIVNYYRDARREQGLEGAAEAAVSHGWAPCLLAAFTTAVGLGSLYISDILPIKKFGMFTAIGVLATVGVLFTVLPVFLHRFPVSDEVALRCPNRKKTGSNLPVWANHLFGFIVRRHAFVLMFWLVVTCGVGVGLTKLGTTVQLLKLLDEHCDLIHDYAWLEHHLGNLVPMEVVLTVPPERCRDGDELADADGMQYRDTMLERLNIIRTMQARIEKLPEISRTLSAATFAKESSDSGNVSADRSVDFANNKILTENRDLLIEAGYLRLEKADGVDEQNQRELWRISSRVAALNEGPDGEDSGGVDYGQFVLQLKHAIEPVLIAHMQRDQLVRALHEKGKQLDGSTIGILFRGPADQAVPEEDTSERLLADLLNESGIKGQTLYANLTKFDAMVDDPEKRDAIISRLTEIDALVIVSPLTDPTLQRLEGGQNVVDVSGVTLPEGSAAVPLLADAGPEPIRAVYTGMVPLVYKTQRQLLFSLKESILGATVLIAIVMMFVLRNPVAGLISMIPNVFPIVVVFGSLGWLGIKIDIGIMMTASVALGVAVDDTIHFLTMVPTRHRRGGSTACRPRSRPTTAAPPR